MEEKEIHAYYLKELEKEKEKHNEYFFRGLKQGREEYEDKIRAMIEERKAIIEDTQYYSCGEREKRQKEIDLLEEILEV